MFGKITLSIIGWQLWGFKGLIIGLILGHYFIDRGRVSVFISKLLNKADLNLRLILSPKLNKIYESLKTNKLLRRIYKISDFVFDFEPYREALMGKKQEPKKKIESAKNLNDCYQLLGIPQNAGDKEIKARWKELIAQYHPDKTQAGGANKEQIQNNSIKTAELNHAYQYIMKSKKL